MTASKKVKKSAAKHDKKHPAAGSTECSQKAPEQDTAVRGALGFSNAGMVGVMLPAWAPALFALSPTSRCVKKQMAMSLGAVSDLVSHLLNRLGAMQEAEGQESAASCTDIRRCDLASSIATALMAVFQLREALYVAEAREKGGDDGIAVLLADRVCMHGVDRGQLQKTVAHVNNRPEEGSVAYAYKDHTLGTFAEQLSYYIGYMLDVSSNSITRRGMAWSALWEETDKALGALVVARCLLADPVEVDHDMLVLLRLLAARLNVSVG